MTVPVAASKSALSVQHEFSANLRRLCCYYRSVADVCRKLGLNALFER